MTGRSSKYATLALMVGGFALAFLLTVFPSNRQTFILADGLKVAVTTVKLGYTNEFREGKKLEQWLGNKISSNGWRFGPWALERPIVHHFYRSTNATLLSVRFRVFGESNILSASPLFASPLREFRIRHWGDPEFPFVEESQDLFFSTGRSGSVGYFLTETFDRRSEFLNLELEQFEAESHSWKSCGVISIRNPDRRELLDWTPLPCPITNRLHDLEVVLGSVEVLKPKLEFSAVPDPQEMTRIARGSISRTAVTKVIPDPWDNAVKIALRYYQDGKKTEEFTLNELAIYDAAGNFSYLRGTQVEINGWHVYQGWRSVLPNVPWKVVGRCARATNFNTAELHLVSLPVSPTSQIVTNLGGLKTFIQFVGPNKLIYGLASLPVMDKRMILVDALNEAGESVKGSGGAVAQHYFLREIDHSRVPSNLLLKIAVVNDVAFEFVVQPALVDEWQPSPL